MSAPLIPPGYCLPSPLTALAPSTRDDFAAPWEALLTPPDMAKDATLSEQCERSAQGLYAAASQLEQWLGAAAIRRRDALRELCAWRVAVEETTVIPGHE